MTKRLGIGMSGSGLQRQVPLAGTRGRPDADVLGVWEPNQNNAADTAGIARQIGVGRRRPTPPLRGDGGGSRHTMRSASGPNHARLENGEEIVSSLERGKGHCGHACEKRWREMGVRQRRSWT